MSPTEHDLTEVSTTRAGLASVRSSTLALARRTARRLPPDARQLLRTGARVLRRRSAPRRPPAARVPAPVADPAAAAEFFRAAADRLTGVERSVGTVGAFLTQLDVVRADERALRRQPWTDHRFGLRDLACAAATDLLAGGRPALADWLATQILAADPGTAAAHDVRALVALERGRKAAARKHRARALGTAPADGEVTTWIRRQQARMAARSVFTDLAGGVDVPDGGASQWWQAALDETDPARRRALQALAAADANRPASGYNDGLWRRRYLLERIDDGPDGHDVIAVRARLDAAETAVRALRPGDGSWAHTTPARVPVPTPHEPTAQRSADADLLARGDALIAAVDNAAAAELFEREVRRPHQLTDRVLLRWALALHRCSRYERALAVLAVCDDRVAADLAATTTAWVLHDHARGAAYTQAVRQRRRNHPRAAELTARFRAAEPSLPTTGRALVHVAAYVGRGGNYGDRVLPLAVRQAVSSVSAEPLAFVSVQAHQLFDASRRELADRSAGVIVGGGGLFLPDTAPNGTSGWQWNVPAEQLRRLDAPLAVVAVGFNLFRGQSFTGGLFAENLAQLVDRADLVGLRNHGSIREVRTLLPAHLAAKIEYLPCPTTVLAHLDPTLADALPRRRSVLINAAYDRSGLRFGSGYGSFLAQLAGYVRALRRADVSVEIVSHMAPDEQLAADLRTDHALDLPLHKLNLVPLDEAYRIYREAGVVVGMRGHAAMIPFGLRTPVLSLVSHPKMRYFLDDIAHPDWGFEVSEPFGAALLERTQHVLAEPDTYLADIATAQQRLLTAIQEPLRRFTG